MNKATIFVCLASFLCACSSHTAVPQSQKLAPDATADLPIAKDPPMKANTRFAAGQVAESQGRLDAAIHQYNAALDIDPKNLPSLYRLGVIYAAMKDYDVSISIWKHYIEVSDGGLPKDTATWAIATN